MDDSVVVALFRHGLTEENKRKAYIGWSDSPICEEARTLLAQHPFTPSPYETIITSDLGRCRQTAQLLFPEETPYVLPEFREINFGLWEQKTYEELKGDPYYREWLDGQFAIAPPKGESYAVFRERVEKGWEKTAKLMADEKTKRIAVVTHGGVIRYLLSRLADRERQFWEWKVPHGNGFELVWQSDEAFRRDEKCTLLREVLLTENQSG